MGWCGICTDTATSHTKLNSWRLCKLLPSLVELVLIKRFTCYIYIYLFLISFFFAALGVDYGSFPLATPSSRPPHTIVWHFANFIFDIALSNFPAKRNWSLQKRSLQWRAHARSIYHVCSQVWMALPRFFKFQESVDAIREGVSYWPS